MINITKKTFGDQTINVVPTKLLKPHPLNKKLYPFDDITGLTVEILNHFKDFGYPNFEPILYCKKTGVIYSGNTRWIIADKEGIEYVYAEPSPYTYDVDNTTDETEIKKLDHYNSKNRRNMSHPLVATASWLTRYSAWVTEHPMANTTEQNKFKKELWMEHGISPPDGKKYVDIYEYDKELLNLLHDNKITLNAAWNMAKGTTKLKKYDESRFNFFDWMEANPEFTKKAYEASVTSVDSIDEIVHCPIFGWEINQITGAVSNTFNSYFAKTFKEFGLDAKTSKHKTGHPDITFGEISKDDYDNEKIEVKAASYNHNTGKTYFYGGPGVKTNNPHEYLFVVWNAKCKKFWTCITTITKDDWKGNTGKKNKKEAYQISLSSLFEKSKGKNYKQIAGEIFEGNKAIEIDWHTI